MAKSERIVVSVPAELMARLEAWETAQSVPVPRSSAMRTALEQWLDREPCAACDAESKTNRVPVGVLHSCARGDGR